MYLKYLIKKKLLSILPISNTFNKYKVLKNISITSLNERVCYLQLKFIQSVVYSKNEAFKLKKIVLTYFK